MSRHPELIDFLRAEGVTVVETNGWQTRGSSLFTPGGSVNHHTAGASSGNAPSLGIVLNGRGTPGHPDYLPPPLCNVLQGRDDKAYLIAAGRANHAGAGGWHELSGNTDVWGLEVEHIGTTAEPFPQHRREVSVRIHTAFAKCSRFTAAMVCQHYEWAGPRKSDFIRALLDPDQFRTDIATMLNHHPGDDDVAYKDWPAEDKLLLVNDIASEVIKRLSEDTPTTKAGERLKDAAHFSKALAAAHTPPLT